MFVVMKLYPWTQVTSFYMMTLIQSVVMIFKSHAKSNNVLAKYGFLIFMHCDKWQF